MKKAVLVALLGLSSMNAASTPDKTEQVFVDDHDLDEQHEEEMAEVDDEADELADSELEANMIDISDPATSLVESETTPVAASNSTTLAMAKPAAKPTNPKQIDAKVVKPSSKQKKLKEDCECAARTPNRFEKAKIAKKEAENRKKAEEARAKAEANRKKAEEAIKQAALVKKQS